MPWKCPECGEENGDALRICVCGHDAEESPAKRRHSRKALPAEKDAGAGPGPHKHARKAPLRSEKHLKHRNESAEFSGVHRFAMKAESAPDFLLAIAGGGGLSIIGLYQLSKGEFGYTVGGWICLALAGLFFLQLIPSSTELILDEQNITQRTKSFRETSITAGYHQLRELAFYISKINVASLHYTSAARTEHRISYEEMVEHINAGSTTLRIELYTKDGYLFDIGGEEYELRDLKKILQILINRCPSLSLEEGPSSMENEPSVLMQIVVSILIISGVMALIYLLADKF